MLIPEVLSGARRYDGAYRVARVGLAADRSTARLRSSLLSIRLPLSVAASLGFLSLCSLPAWSQAVVPAAEVISVEEVEESSVELEGASSIPTKPLRINTGLVTIESDQQQADQQTGVITARGNVRIVYPDERVVATARQAQYFSNEGRVVLSGDVDILQDGGNWLRAEQVIYLVDSERMQAIPARGQQVFSRVVLQTIPSSGPETP